MLGNNLVVALCSVNLGNKISALLTDTSSFSVNFCSTLAPFTSLLDTHSWYLLFIVLLLSLIEFLIYDIDSFGKLLSFLNV